MLSILTTSRFLLAEVKQRMSSSKIIFICVYCNLELTLAKGYLRIRKLLSQIYLTIAVKLSTTPNGCLYRKWTVYFQFRKRSNCINCRDYRNVVNMLTTIKYTEQVIPYNRFWTRRKKKKKKKSRLVENKDYSQFIKSSFNSLIFKAER